MQRARALAPRHDRGDLPARSGRQRLRPRSASVGTAAAEARRGARARARSSTGSTGQRPSRSRSSRARRTSPTWPCSRGGRGARPLQSSVVLAVRGEGGRRGARRPPLRRRRSRARRVHAGGDRAARDGRRADRRRDREQPRLLAHEGARSPRRARLDGGRSRARGEEPARRDQGRGAAPRGGRRVDAGRSDRARVPRHHPRGGGSPRSRRRELPRLRAPARRQPDPARHERRRPPHGADPLEPEHRRGHRRAARARRPAPARADRSGEAPPGADEPDPERDPGDGRARQDHRVDVGPALAAGEDGVLRRGRAAVAPLARGGRRGHPGSRGGVVQRGRPGRGQRARHRPGNFSEGATNLFVPFFTTKTQGTGLGLAISQSIVRNAGGTIEVQTQPGAGTTFTIVLPSAGDSLATPIAAEVSQV